MSDKKRVFAHAQLKKKTEQDWPEFEPITKALNEEQFKKQFLCNPKQEEDDD